MYLKLQNEGIPAKYIITPHKVEMMKHEDALFLMINDKVHVGNKEHLQRLCLSCLHLSLLFWDIYRVHKSSQTQKVVHTAPS